MNNDNCGAPTPLLDHTKERKWITMLPHSFKQEPAQRTLNDLRLTHLGLVVTVIASILFIRDQLQAGISALFTCQYGLYLEDSTFVIIVAFLIYGNLIYQFMRIGYLKRLASHKPTENDKLEEFLNDENAPELVILVPSYKEDPRVNEQTLFSAALQEYPTRRVVLLIDNPPNPGNFEDEEKLNLARDAPYKIQRLLAEEDKRLHKAYSCFAARLKKGHVDIPTEAAYLAVLYEEVALWFKDQAEAYPIRDHTDEFFVQHIFLQPFHEFHAKSQVLKAQHTQLSQKKIYQEYNRLRTLFHVELSSFERKRYDNLSHEPNKAMNLNSYISLFGKSYREIQRNSGLFLEEVPAAFPNAMHIPDAKYIITLDADSLLLPSYAARLIYYMEQPENKKVAVAQTPYSAIPKAPRLIEKIAGATTDIQYIIHQGFTYYNSTYWVGANAVLRKEALIDICQVTQEGNITIKKYIHDSTVIEDTESTIDLIEKGWRLYNYPERLAYTATPPDFGSLLVQRRRWANGGWIIAPKLIRLFFLRRPLKFERLIEGVVRLHYLLSIGGASLMTLLIMLIPFNNSLNDIWLPLTALPYYFLYARDLVKIGYSKSDILSVYALNLMLIPIHLGGAFMSLKQTITGKKGRFGRTPKVKERTRAPRHYVLSEVVLLIYCTSAGALDLLLVRLSHAIFSTVNIIVFLAIFTRFIGWKESKEDLFERK
jgi:cellulose synthase (UDP-forming)